MTRGMEKRKERGRSRGKREGTPCSTFQSQMLTWIPRRFGKKESNPNVRPIKAKWLWLPQPATVM